MSDGLDCDVVVIGMGPIGAAMALALAEEGLQVTVVEPFDRPFDKPRAIGIDHDALRLLQRFGVMDEVAGQLGEYRSSEYRAADGQVLRRIHPQPAPYPQGWPPYSTFIQPQLEVTLRKACAANPRIELLFGHMAERVSQSEGQVAVVALPVGFEAGQPRAVPGAQPRVVRAQYAVACDGARSPVREALAMGIVDFDFCEQWLVVDVIAHGPVDLPDVTVQYCNATRPATYIAGPKDLHRWEIMLLPGEDGPAMAEDDKVWELLAPWIAPDQGTLWRAASYQFNARVSREWQSGRVFLAGDSAHQTPPFMAQGLNQGFRDVANLAWKIGAVINCGASPALLETYTAERRPNVANVIALTKDLGKLICECDPARAAERNRAMLAEMAAGKGEFVRQDMLPPLLPGPLVLDGARFGTGAGQVIPQPFIQHGVDRLRMDDVLGAGFQLFVTDAGSVEQDFPGLDVLHIDRAEGPGALREVDGLLAGWFKARGVCAALVRPDRVVFGTAKAADDVPELVDALFAALGIEAGAMQPVAAA